jgi:hypothetical protein
LGPFPLALSGGEFVAGAFKLHGEGTYPAGVEAEQGHGIERAHGGHERGPLATECGSVGGGILALEHRTPGISGMKRALTGHDEPFLRGEAPAVMACK